MINDNCVIIMISLSAKIAISRIFYPIMGFMGGNTACYPKQTYKVTSKTLTTTLPLVATAGKATVDGIVKFHSLAGTSGLQPHMVVKI